MKTARELILRNAVIWAEIKAKEQEYDRIKKQIDNLEDYLRDISASVQNKLMESQSIGEKLHDMEARYLIENNL